MGLNTFINNGMDDQLLRSMNAENCHEELVKAMNTQGLVQKEVQVHGKNGQVFTRKQWVKASEDQPSDKQKQSHVDSTESTNKPVDVSQFQFKNYLNPDGQSHPRRKSYRDTLVDVSKETEDAFNSSLSFYGGNMPPAEQLKTVFSRINNHATYRDLKSSKPEMKGLMDARNAISDRQKQLIEQAKQYTKWDGKKWTKASDEVKTDKPAGKQDDGKKIEDNEFESFTIYWHNNGSHYENFSSLSELKEGLKRKGLPEYLADFNGKKLDKENGYVKNDYKNYGVYAYPKDQPEKTTKNDNKQVSTEIPENIKEMLSNNTIDKKKFDYNGFKVEVYYSGKIEIFDENEKVLSTYSKRDAFEHLTKHNKNSKSSDDSKQSSATGSARQDYYKAGNFYNVGKSGNFAKDIQFLSDRPNGVTVRIRHVDNTETYALKTDKNKWTTDSGKTLSNNDIASSAYQDDAKVSVNYMVHTQPKSSDVDKHKSQKFTPASFGFRAGGENVADLVNAVDKELGVKKLANGNTGFGTLNLENGESVNFGYDDKSAFITWSGVRYRDAKELSDKMNGRKTLVESGKATDKASSEDKSKDSKKESDNKIKSYEDKATGTTNLVGKFTDESKKKAIDEMSKRGYEIDKDHTDKLPDGNEQLSFKKKESPKTSTTKLSKEDAKKKTQSFTSNVGKTDADRNAFMEKVKAQGITWKDSNDNGSEITVAVNWMRCLMAMNKHFANGGEWKEDTNLSAKSKPTQSNPTKVTGKSGKPYSIWMEGSSIKGSIPGKEDSRNARDIKNFTSQGFNSLEEVEEYVKKYF